MNRIYELAKQCDLIKFEKISGSKAVTPNHTDVVNTKRFAELLVNECVHIAYNKMAIQKKDGIQPTTVCDAIREHFGLSDD